MNFDVLDNFKKEQLDKHRSHHDYEILKEAYSELGLSDSNKIQSYKKSI